VHLRRLPAVRRAPRFALGVVLAALLSGCGILPPQGTAAVHPGTLQPPTSSQVSTVPVQYGVVQKTVQVAGVLAPIQQALLYFHDSGTVTVLNMQVGQTVKQGQLLASFNTNNDLYQIAEQRLAVRADELNIQNLLQQDATAAAASPQQAAQANLALANARIQLQRDEIQLAQDQLTLREDQVVAPFTGVVAKVNIQVGQYVQSDQVIAELDDDRQAQLVAKLPTADVSEVAPGDPVAVSLTSSTTNQLLYTTVASVQVPTPDQIAVAQSNPSLGALSKPQVTLKLPSGFTFSPSDIGDAFQAQITVAQAQNVLYLPSDVIFSFNGLDYVNLDRNGVVTERPVQVGLEGDQDTVILAGLKVGDQVVQ
jgi:RND family efflux transporter MFP subunit